jgi:hypothetical protein
MRPNPQENADGADEIWRLRYTRLEYATAKDVAAHLLDTMVLYVHVGNSKSDLALDYERYSGRCCPSQTVRRHISSFCDKMGTIDMQELIQNERCQSACGYEWPLNGLFPSEPFQRPTLNGCLEDHANRRVNGPSVDDDSGKTDGHCSHISPSDVIRSISPVPSAGGSRLPDHARSTSSTGAHPRLDLVSQAIWPPIPLVSRSIGSSRRRLDHAMERDRQLEATTS